MRIYWLPTRRNFVRQKIFDIYLARLQNATMFPIYFICCFYSTPPQSLIPYFAFPSQCFDDIDNFISDLNSLVKHTRSGASYTNRTDVCIFVVFLPSFERFENLPFQGLVFSRIILCYLVIFRNCFIPLCVNWSLPFLVSCTEYDALWRTIQISNLSICNPGTVSYSYGVRIILEWSHCITNDSTVIHCWSLKYQWVQRSTLRALESVS